MHIQFHYFFGTLFLSFLTVCYIKKSKIDIDWYDFMMIFTSIQNMALDGAVRYIYKMTRQNGYVSRFSRPSDCHLQTFVTCQQNFGEQKQLRYSTFWCNFCGCIIMPQNSETYQHQWTVIVLTNYIIIWKGVSSIDMLPLLAKHLW